MPQSLSKAQLAQKAGVSSNTFRRWLNRLAPSIPDYRPEQKLLTPAQVQAICNALCIDLNE